MKKTLLLSIFLLIFCAASQAQQSYQYSQPVAPHLNKSLQILKNPADKRVLVIAHRADWRNSPENSIPAIRNAIAMGVDMVEIDLQRTKDGHLVLMHDGNLNRTTNGKGNVSDWTLDSIKTLYLKDGLGMLTPHKVPTLEEAMNEIKGKILVNLDKGYSYFAQACEILQRTGSIHQAVMKSSEPAQKVLAENGPQLKQMMYMAVINLDQPNALKQIKDYQSLVKPVAFELILKSDTSKVLGQLKQLQKNGSRFWINSLWDNLSANHGDERAMLDPDGNYGWMLGKGFSLIQTDRPAFLINYLNKKQLR